MRRWRRPRLSLLSFLLAVSLFCLAVTNFRVTHENKRLKEQNDELMEQSGYLVVHDPSKVYFRRVESLDEDDLTWRFQIYLPPRKQYMFYTQAGNSFGGSSISGEGKQLTVVVALRRNAAGNWEIRRTMPRSAGAGDADPQVVEQVREINFPTYFREDQKETDPDEPFDLFQLLDGEFHIWIEPGGRGFPKLYVPPRSLRAPMQESKTSTSEVSRHMRSTVAG